MMEPAGPEEPRSRPYRPEWFGNLGRLVLEALRDAPEPMTSMQVAAKVIALCGLETTDRAMQGWWSGESASLNRRIGLVEKVPRGVRDVAEPSVGARRGQLVPSPWSAQACLQRQQPLAVASPLWRLGPGAGAWRQPCATSRRSPRPGCASIVGCNAIPAAR